MSPSRPVPSGPTKMKAMWGGDRDDCRAHYLGMMLGLLWECSNDGDFLGAQPLSMNKMKGMRFFKTNEILDRRPDIHTSNIQEPQYLRLGLLK